MGHSFEQLRYMIDRVEDQSRVGVCLDTCHMFAAGYDLATPAAYAATMQRFDDVVGLRFLKGTYFLTVLDDALSYLPAVLNAVLEICYHRPLRASLRFEVY